MKSRTMTGTSDAGKTDDAARSRGGWLTVCILLARGTAALRCHLVGVWPDLRELAYGCGSQDLEPGDHQGTF
jgi:hypothetical protein